MKSLLISPIRTLRYLVLSAIFAIVMNPFSTCGEGRRAIYFRDYLEVMGDKFDCYFTVENIKLGSNVDHPLLSATIAESPDAPKDINDLINTLTNKMRIVFVTLEESGGDVASGVDATSNRPQIKWTTNILRIAATNIGHGTPIIRISDAQLSPIRNYSLDRLDSVSFSGSPAALVQKLSEKVASLKSCPSLSRGSISFASDMISHVEIVANEQTIYDLLTKHISLSGYNRVLWSSLVDLSVDEPTVEVWFQGPRRLPAKSSVHQ